MKELLKHTAVRGDGLYGLQTFTNEHGNTVVQRITVFRAGSFADSKGVRRTWTAADLQAMVTNFNYLRDNGVLTNVPWREDHSKSIESVIGYFAGLETDGRLLYADLEFTSPKALEKWQNRHYRARSIEIGAYETNDEAIFYPAVLGCAFVDIGAVEGLFNHSNIDNPYGFSMLIQEDPMSGTPAPTPTPAAPPAPPAPPAAPPADPVLHAAPVAPAPVPAPVAPAAPAAPVLATFSINGQPTTDFAAVQAHIASLEQWHSSARESGRKDFVKGLITSNRIGAPQEAAMTALALSMSDPQFEAFKLTYEAAPPQGLLTPQVGAPGATPTPAGGAAPEPSEFETAKATVEMLRRGGMSEEQVQKTSSFQKMTHLTPKQ